MWLNKYVDIIFPAGSGPFPAVVDIFGARGGGNLDYRAALLASRGFVSYSLPFFAYEDLPTTLDNIQLEYFEVKYFIILLSGTLSGIWRGWVKKNKKQKQKQKQTKNKNKNKKNKKQKTKNKTKQKQRENKTKQNKQTKTAFLISFELFGQRCISCPKGSIFFYEWRHFAWAWALWNDSSFVLLQQLFATFKESAEPEYHSHMGSYGERWWNLVVIVTHMIRTKNICSVASETKTCQN